MEKNPAAARIIEDKCIGCSHCGMVCPVSAVLADGRPMPDPPVPEVQTDYEKIDDFIRSKRSVRAYRSAPILTEDLEEILTTGSLTATASNSQQCRPVVLQGGEVAAASSLMARQLLKLVRIVKNPLVRAIASKTPLARYADRETVERFENSLLKTLEGKADPLFFRAPTVVILTYPKKGKRFGRTDCALAGAHMMLTAKARGIGSCMIGFAEVALRKRKNKTKLGIPKDREIGLIFTLGYSDRKYYRHPVRKSWELP